MTALTIPKPPDRLDWLKARKGFFNASDVPCLYDSHPHRDIADVVADKLAPEVVDGGQTEAMDRGVRLEPVMLEWLGDRLGVRVVTPDVLHVNGCLMATLDGEPVGADDVWVEAKTTAERWDAVPTHVYWQVAAQAAASGRRECHVVWIDSDLRFKTAVVVPHPEHVEDVLARAETFMAFIEMGMTPEGVQLTADHVLTMFPRPEVGTWVTLDDAGRDAIVAWEEARTERIAAEKREKALKGPVATLLSGAEGAKYQGLPIVTWRCNKDGEGFIVGEHEAGEPECHAKYTRTTKGARVLRATKELRTFQGVRT